jgi:hypothetical protein
MLTRASPLREGVYLSDRAIIHRHGKTLAFHVENQVLPHDRKSNKSNVRIIHKLSYKINFSIPHREE